MPPCGGAPYWKARYMPPNFSSSTSLVVARDREGLPHDVRAVVADRAGGHLVAVADDVVLVGRERQDALACRRVERQERVGLDRRHRERVVREVDLLLVLVPLVLREVDDPGRRRTGPCREAELVADADARLAGERRGLRLRRRRRRTPRRRPSGRPCAAIAACDRRSGMNLAIGPLPASAPPSSSNTM